MTADVATAESANRSWRSRRRLGRRGVVIAVVALVAATAVGTSGLLRSASAKPSATIDRASSLVTITERTITSQQQVDGSLGFAGAVSVLEPVGSTPDALAQADGKMAAAAQSLAQAGADLRDAEASLSDDARTLSSDQGRLSADTQKEASDCQGAGAASGSSGNGTDSSGARSTSCEADRQAVAADEKQVDVDSQKVSADQKAVAHARASVISAEQSSILAQPAVGDAHESALAFGPTSTYTSLPGVGQVLNRGDPIFSINAQPVPLLYGPVTPWRAFRPGMTAGPDVRALNQNLADVGHDASLAGSDTFSSATGAAIRKLQRALGLPPTGELLLGSAVFEPGAVRVTAVTPKLGAAVQPGAPVLDVTSTTRQITVKLDAGQQSQVKVGVPVVITLPDKTTTPATVTAVGTVATQPPSSGPAAGSGPSSQPTVDVVITPSDNAATGNLDAAPVQVSITTASAEHALVVPVTALLALGGGGYGVDVVAPSGAHRLAAVTLGLFDDAGGLVQISGAEVHAGDRVAVAAS